MNHRHRRCGDRNRTDDSALQETTERAVEILDSHGEPVTIARRDGGGR